ncbi:hypothetical protein HO173_005098 [Letharia columbiana]|uniref:Uncharacterized protein n=1 Tax=Letharia columbiana TaxID=112416 RepID=A0A8H6FXU7_9LECA|nr:uncharacterized protein HO173_005098 [Letharia columbiana]KAF6236807.1 hypothetical protein HO173_005098 [Letharia columbiana]
MRRDEIAWLFLHLPEDVLKDGDEGMPKSLEDLRRNEGVYQPNIRLLPDTRLRWNDEGWKKRGLYGMVGYHLFYTLTKGEPLTPNPYVAGKVSGDMFLLQASDDIDSGWRRFYVDVSSEIGFSSQGGKTYIEDPHIGRFEIQMRSVEQLGGSWTRYYFVLTVGLSMPVLQSNSTTIAYNLFSPWSYFSAETS